MAFRKSVVGILIVIIGLAACQNQRVTLYDQYNKAGDYIVIPETYAADLSSINFDNKAHSTSGTGIWLFYEDPNYNPIGGRRVEYFVGKNINEYVNLLTLAGRVSSVRYAGNPTNYMIDSFTLYEHITFQGVEEYITSQQSPLQTLNGNHKSIIITGTSDWTVYDQPNYQGSSVCLSIPQPNGSSPSFINDLQSDAGTYIPYGSIKSVKKGCLSQVKVKMASFANAQ